jgi:hypothetical protein
MLAVAIKVKTKWKFFMDCHVIILCSTKGLSILDNLKNIVYAVKQERQFLILWIQMELNKHSMFIVNDLLPSITIIPAFKCAE